MGFEPEDAMIFALRSDLADAIAKHLKARFKRQTPAADLLGLSQAAVSNIMRGKIDHLSVERLIRAMVRAKIPGFAEWPTADTARAGELTARAVSSTVRDSVTFDGPASVFRVLPSPSGARGYFDLGPN